jgi:hypothetical protein
MKVAADASQWGELIAGLVNRVLRETDPRYEDYRQVLCGR